MCFFLVWLDTVPQSHSPCVLNYNLITQYFSPLYPPPPHILPHQRPAGLSSSRMIELLYFCDRNQRSQPAVTAEIHWRWNFPVGEYLVWAGQWGEGRGGLTGDWSYQLVQGRCVCFTVLWPSTPVNTKRVKNTVGFFLITRTSLMPERGGLDNTQHLTTQDGLKWL